MTAAATKQTKISAAVAAQSQDTKRKVRPLVPIYVRGEMSNCALISLGVIASVCVLAMVFIPFFQ
jgi:hypothetical protein